MKRKTGYQSSRLSFNRRAVIASASISREKNAKHSFTGVDITEPRKLTRAHFEKTGEKRSFRAYIVTCLAHAIKDHPPLNSFINEKIPNMVTKNRYMDILIRQETRADHKEVFRLIESAFQHEAHSDHDEQFLVERLRQSEAFIPELSLVAEAEGRIVGHILLTRIHIENGTDRHESLALAPVSVLPEFHNKGIGSLLIRTSHSIAEKLGFHSIILLGHEHYYPRFGYRPTVEFGIKLPFDAPEACCMIIELTKGALKGVHGIVAYPGEFFESYNPLPSDR